jgi:hypothetical protein
MFLNYRSHRFFNDFQLTEVYISNFQSQTYQLFLIIEVTIELIINCEVNLESNK